MKIKIQIIVLEQILIQITNKKTINSKNKTIKINKKQMTIYISNKI